MSQDPKVRVVVEFKNGDTFSSDSFFISSLYEEYLKEGIVTENATVGDIIGIMEYGCKSLLEAIKHGNRKSITILRNGRDVLVPGTLVVNLYPTLT